MSDELTSAPRIDGEFWVFPNGQRMARVRGAEGEPEGVVEDTPTDDAAPDDGTPADESDYTPERARGLHAELTRTQQELATARAERELWQRAKQGDLDAMRELNLPLEFGDDDADSEDDEDPAFQDPRLDALLQEREQERLQKEQEEGWNRFNTDLDRVAKGKTLDDDDRLMIYTKTLQAGGSPDALQQAYSEYAKRIEARDKAAVQAYLDSKRNAPFVSPGGTGANEVTDPLDGHSRRERLAARMAAQEAD